MYHGDIRLGQTIDIKFTTVDSAGLPTTLGGSPVVSAYPDNSTTELTAGITLTVDFDARTGLHNIRVVATSGNGYLTATNYMLIITTGTVSGASVVGYVVGSFSIENRSALMSTTAANKTLDVTASGEAGIDWGNIGSAGAAQNLSGTTVDLIAGAVDAAALAADAVAEIAAAILTTPANTLATDASGRVTVGSNADKTGYSIGAGGITAASFAAAAIDAAALAADATLEIADALLKRDMAAVTGESARSFLNAIRFLRNKWTIAAGTLTVTKEDDVTTAWTAAVTQTAGNPVSEVDPA